MISLLGIVAGAFFAYAAVPQAIRTIRAGKHLGTPVDLAAIIFIGTLLMWSYLFLTYGFNLILTINYAVEAWSWGVLLWYWGKNALQNTPRLD